MNEKHRHILFGILLPAGVYAISVYSYLVLHSIWEMLAIAVATSLFLISWNIAHFLRDDFRDLQRTENMAHASERLYRQMFLEHSAPKLLIDPQTASIEEANQAAVDFYGYSMERMRGMKISEINTLPAEKIAERIKEIEDRKCRRFVFRHRLASGEMRDVEVHSTPIDVGGRVLLYSIIHDVTERNLMESRLRESEKTLKAVLDATSDAIFLLDRNCHVLLANESAARRLGLTTGESIGTCLLDRLPPDLSASHKADFDWVLRMNKRREFEDRRDGKWYFHSLFPILDEAGEVERVAIFIQDVTRRKEAEFELLRRTESLVWSNAELERFAYVASHDLREPLRMVSSYLTLIDTRYRDKLDDKAEEFISYAVEGADRMQKMISGLLAYSRLTTRMSNFDLVESGEVVREAIENLRLLVEEREARIHAEDLPRVTADRTQLVRVFQNLIDNAIKFCTKAPVVRIRAEKRDREWLFSVSDNGIGIDPRYADEVFQIFRRLHTQKEYPGTGIGLTLCKRIVERHGGRIWLESAGEGTGTAFCFTMPAGEDWNE